MSRSDVGGDKPETGLDPEVSPTLTRFDPQQRLTQQGQIVVTVTIIEEAAQTIVSTLDHALRGVARKVELRQPDQVPAMSRQSACRRASFLPASDNAIAHPRVRKPNLTRFTAGCTLFAATR